MTLYQFGSMKVKKSQITPIKKSDLKLLQEKDERGMSQNLTQ